VCRLQQADRIERLADRELHRADGMLHDREHRSVVLGEVRGSEKRHRQAGPAPHLRDFSIIGAEDHRIEPRTRERHVGAVLEERPAVQRPDVLAGDPFRAAARRDEAEDAHQ
jgi:hypothetical protein